MASTSCAASASKDSEPEISRDRLDRMVMAVVKAISGEIRARPFASEYARARVVVVWE